MVLHYYLADDTVELHETCPAGRRHGGDPRELSGERGSRRRSDVPAPLSPAQDCRATATARRAGRQDRAQRVWTDGQGWTLHSRQPQGVYSRLQSSRRVYLDSHRLLPPPCRSTAITSTLRSSDILPKVCTLPSAIVLLYDNLNHYQLT